MDVNAQRDEVIITCTHAPSSGRLKQLRGNTAGIVRTVTGRTEGVGVVGGGRSWGKIKKGCRKITGTAMAMKIPHLPTIVMGLLARGCSH